MCPLKGRKNSNLVELSDDLPDQALRQAKLKKMMEKMERVLNPQKIDLYVLNCMKDRKEMMASELPLQTTEDFVHMIYVRLYGQRKNMKYKIETGKRRQ